MIVNTKLVGVTFQGRQEVIRELEEGQTLFWIKDHKNPHDENAIEVFADSGLRKSVGHLSRKVAEKLRFAHIVVRVAKITGGGQDRNLGVNVVVETIPPMTPHVVRNEQV